MNSGELNSMLGFQVIEICMLLITRPSHPVESQPENDSLVVEIVLSHCERLFRDTGTRRKTLRIPVTSTTDSNRKAAIDSDTKHRLTVDRNLGV